MKFPVLNKSAVIFIAAIILLAAVNIGLIFYLLQSRKIENPQSVNPGNIEQKGGSNPEELAKEIAPGTVGELEQKPGQSKEEALATVNPSALDNPVIPAEISLPAVVFNTQGTIISIQDDGIIVDGNGSNFEDQLPRQIKVKFDEKTVVSEIGGTIKYTGSAGLKHLAAGDRISLSSAQNIRAKTEFTAKYVNKQ